MIELNYFAYSIKEDNCNFIIGSANNLCLKSLNKTVNHGMEMGIVFSSFLEKHYNEKTDFIKLNFKLKNMIPHHHLYSMVNLTDLAPD